MHCGEGGNHCETAAGAIKLQSGREYGFSDDVCQPYQNLMPLSGLDRLLTESFISGRDFSKRYCLA